MDRGNLPDDFHEGISAWLLVDSIGRHAGSQHSGASGLQEPANLLGVGERLRSDRNLDQRGRLSLDSEDDCGDRVIVESLRGGTSGDFYGHHDVDRGTASGW